MLASPCQAKGGHWALQSASGDLTVNVRSVPGNGLEYRVSTTSGPVVDWSPLGLVLSSQDSDLERKTHDVPRNLEHAGSRQHEVCDEYTLKVGKRLENRVCGKELVIDFSAPGDLSLSVVFRAYDDGVAFRYVVGANARFVDSLSFELVTEKTAFDMSPATRVFQQPYDHADSWRPSYEAAALSAGGVIGQSTPKELGAGWSMPMLFEAGKDWVLIHESGLSAQSHGSHIAPEVVDDQYRIAGPLADEALGHGSEDVHFALPWNSPWRVLIIGSLSKIVQSTMVQTLAEPASFDGGWVRPGRASWSWLSDHDSSQDPGKMTDFVDLAAEMGWEYSLVDANWNRIPEAEFSALLSHAAKKNVGLLLWYNSGGSNNAVTEAPRNLMADRALRRAEFERISKLGIRGVKVDFWHSDKQFMMQRYLDLLADAADFRLLVNFHGSTIPRGWERTFPNLVTMEAVRGHEFYTFKSKPDYGALAPSQNALVPFMRNVVGPMDSTPVIFAPKLISRRTTKAHEAALGVVYESGIQHFSDETRAYRELPGEWQTYLKALPTAWDETRLLDGYPGKYAVLARRKGDRWWVGAINGTPEPRSLVVDLSFISGAMTMLGDRDGKPISARLEQSTSATPIQLAPYGGVVLYPASSH